MNSVCKSRLTFSLRFSCLSLSSTLSFLDGLLEVAAYVSNVSVHGYLKWSVSPIHCAAICTRSQCQLYLIDGQHYLHHTGHFFLWGFDGKSLERAIDHLVIPESVGSLGLQAFIHFLQGSIAIDRMGSPGSLFLPQSRNQVSSDWTPKRSRSLEVLPPLRDESENRDPAEAHLSPSFSRKIQGLQAGFLCSLFTLKKQKKQNPQCVEQTLLSSFFFFEGQDLPRALLLPDKTY